MVSCLAATLGCDTGAAAAPTLEPSPLPPGTTAPRPRRTVERRHPFGNTSTPDNLMMDGDFEWTGRQGQMPWIAFAARRQATLQIETGGRCRSGLRCARLEPGSALIGWIASPRTEPIHVSVWVKPSHGDCGQLTAAVFDLENQGDAKRGALTADPTPSNQGWCRLRGTAPNFAGAAPVLWLELAPGAPGTLLVDDAVASPEPAPLHATRGAVVLKPPARARVADAARWWTTHRRLGRAPARTLDDPPETWGAFPARDR